MSFIYKDDMVDLIRNTAIDEMMIPAMNGNLGDAAAIAYYNYGIKSLMETLIDKLLAKQEEEEKADP